MADQDTLLFTDRAGLAQGGVLLYLASGALAEPGTPPAILRVPRAEALAAGEAELQLLEGQRYEYECSDPAWRLALKGLEAQGVVRPSRLAGRQHSGLLVPGLATGLVQLVLEDAAGQALAWAGVEVRSRKLDYKTDYRLMMEDISARCVDLLGDWRAAAHFKAVPDAGADARTAGQRFAFVRALLDSQGFRDALHRITSQPNQRWELQAQDQALARGIRPDRRTLTQLARGARRVPLPATHPLQGRLASVPERVTVWRAVHVDDTPENRFVKFALQGFQHFLAQVARKVPADTQPRLLAEVAALRTQLDLALNSDVLRHVGQPAGLPLGSPVLQQREGYREVLQSWLRFALAARLVWQGGEAVYGAGQRDVATLYEYWTFFSLLDLVSALFTLDKPAGKSLLEPTADGFGLKLKAGRFLALDGRSRQHGRLLRVQLAYNRSFGGAKLRGQAGSWTEAMRPDITLSLWPDEFSPSQAEQQELMVHVHFDAKYRVEGLFDLLDADAAVGASADNDDPALAAALEGERQQQAQGSYKRADLLKMHAYRDAIRRTQGAYVLYPGQRDLRRQGFHEVLPGLGAFALRPGAGSDALRKFLFDVVAHVCDRASAREQLSYAAYRNYRVEETSPLYAAVPERMALGTAERHTPPRQTHVLLGWCKGLDHLAWVRQHGLYNFRMDAGRGSLALSPEVAGASYLLLHGVGGQAVPGLWRIVQPQAGPRVFSSQALTALGYPGRPSQPHYLVFNVEPAGEFDGATWDLAALLPAVAIASVGVPLSLSLDVVIRARV